jgi:ATP synthase subunit 6
VSALRPLLILAVIIGACFTSVTYSEHHEGGNEEAFQVLYMHLMPANLVHPSHADEEHAAAPSEAKALLASSDDEAGEAHADDAAHEHHAAKPLISIGANFMPAGADMDKTAEGTQIVFTNLQLFQVAAILVMLIALSGVAGHLRTGKGDKMTRILAGWCQWIRDEMVTPNMHGEDGRKFLSYFLYVFFFIVTMNVLGLVPGSATATANIFVTAALATTTLLAMLGCGMIAQGPIAFWKNLVPHVPLLLWPLMFLVEVLGLFVKPFSLMIRLFANMTGGHLVVLSFMGLIFYFAGADHSPIAWGIAPVAVGFAVFIMIIEAFVALLQAYIFTQLSVMFVGSSVHPEH